MIESPRRTDGKAAESAEVRDFLLVVRRALLVICAYIEKRYMTDRSC